MKYKFQNQLFIQFVFILLAQLLYGQAATATNLPATRGVYILNTRDAIVTIADSAGDIIITKMDTMCNHIWSKTLGDPSVLEYGYCVDQTPEGGFILIGRRNTSATEYETWMIKLDSLGNEIWNRLYYNSGTYPGSVGIFCNVVDSTHYFLVHLRLQYMAPPHLVAMMVDNNGVFLWETTISDSAYSPTVYNYVKIQNGFILGSSIGLGGYTFQISRIDTLGSILSTNTYNGPINSRPVIFQFLEPAMDGSFLFGGAIYNSPLNRMFPLYGKLDSLGNVLWMRSLTSSVPNLQRVLAAQCLIDSTCLLLVESDSQQSFLAKINQSGDTLWLISYQQSFHFRSLEKINESRYSLLGEYTDSLSGNVNIAYQELDEFGNQSNCLFVSVSEFNSKAENYISIFPNPTNNKFKVKADLPESGEYHWELVNCFGKIVCSGSLSVFIKGPETIEVSDFNEHGLLHFRIYSKKYLAKKMVLIIN